MCQVDRLLEALKKANTVPSPRQLARQLDCVRIVLREGGIVTVEMLAAPACEALYWRPMCAAVQALTGEPEVITRYGEPCLVLDVVI